MAGGALAPIHTSTGSAGRSAMLACVIWNRRGKGTDLFSHQNRGPQGEQEQTTGRSFAPLREKTPEHWRVLIIGRRGDMLIADKKGIEPSAVRRRRSLDHPARALARVPCVRVITCERHPYFHRVTPAGGSWFNFT